MKQSLHHDIIITVSVQAWRKSVSCRTFSWDSQWEVQLPWKYIWSNKKNGMVCFLSRLCARYFSNPPTILKSGDHIICIVFQVSTYSLVSNTQQWRVVYSWQQVEIVFPELTINDISFIICLSNSAEFNILQSYVQLCSARYYNLSEITPILFTYKS